MPSKYLDLLASRIVVIERHVEESLDHFDPVYLLRVGKPGDHPTKTSPFALAFDSV